MTSSALGRGRPAWAALLLVLALSLSAVALTRMTEHTGSPVWWPASGLLVAVVVLCPRRWWPPLLALAAGGTTAVHLLTGTAVAWSVSFGASAALSTLVGASLLTRHRTSGGVTLSTQADLVRLVLAAHVSAGLAGAMAAGTALLDPASGVDAWLAFCAVGSAHAAAVLVVLAVVLPHTAPEAAHSWPEVLAQTSFLLAALFIAFAPGQHVAMACLPLPFLAWGAYRLGLRVVSWQLLVVAVTVSVLSAAGVGPFATAADGVVDPLLAGAIAQAFLSCTALLCLPMSIAMAQSHHLTSALRAERDLSEMTLATASCLVLVSDMSGTLLRVNPAATRLLGVEADTLIGTPAWGLVPREHRAKARSMFDSPDGSSLPATAEGRLVDHTGEVRRVLWSTGIVRDTGGNPTHLVLTGLDVTAELNAAGHTAHLLRAPIDTAIVGIDRQGRITLANSGAEAVLGRPAEALVGTPFIRVLSAAELAEWARGFRVKPDFASLLAQAVDAAPRDWHWLGDGTSTLVSMELSRIIDNQGSLVGYLCVANDVTETRTRQQLLVDALDKERHVVDRLRELDATKDHFVTTVSHELRTPVTTIVGYTEMLTAGDLGELSPAQVKALSAINRNGERLVTLVDNLLALAGVTGEVVAVERERVDLVEIAKEAERQAGALLQGRQLTAIFDFPGEPVPVGGERRQLSLVISNLLSNSIKFTEDGGEVRCTVSRAGEHAVLEVRDNGLGIPEEEQENLFGRFWRSSTAVSRHIQGTGLGLATAQAIVAAHEGTITVTSAHLAGTTVRVELPLRQEVGANEQRGPRAERTRRERSGPLRPRRPGLPELTRRAGRSS